MREGALFIPTGAQLHNKLLCVSNSGEEPRQGCSEMKHPVGRGGFLRIVGNLSASDAIH